jgi:hypothetical protein
MRTRAGVGKTPQPKHGELRGTFSHRYIQLSSPECIVIIITGLARVRHSIAWRQRQQAPAGRPW